MSGPALGGVLPHVHPEGSNAKLPGFKLIANIYSRWCVYEPTPPSCSSASIDKLLAIAATCMAAALSVDSTYITNDVLEDRQSAEF